MAAYTINKDQEQRINDLALQLFNAPDIFQRLD